MTFFVLQSKDGGAGPLSPRRAGRQPLSSTRERLRSSVRAVRSCVRCGWRRARAPGVWVCASRTVAMHVEPVGVDAHGGRSRAPVARRAPGTSPAGMSLWTVGALEWRGKGGCAVARTGRVRALRARNTSACPGLQRPRGFRSALRAGARTDFTRLSHCMLTDNAVACGTGASEREPEA